MNQSAPVRTSPPALTLLLTFTVEPLPRDQRISRRRSRDAKRKTSKDASRDGTTAVGRESRGGSDQSAPVMTIPPALTLVLTFIVEPPCREPRLGDLSCRSPPARDRFNQDKEWTIRISVADYHAASFDNGLDTHRIHLLSEQSFCEECRRSVAYEHAASFDDGLDAHRVFEPMK